MDRRIGHLRVVGDAAAIEGGAVELHPTEAARRALLEAAAIETPHLARALRRVAESLPDRAPLSPLVAPPVRP